MTYDLVITDSHVILPQGMVQKNIVIDEGKIVQITNDTPSSDHKINGNGLVSIPGPIDTHVHYGVYSPIDEAGITESHAAAIGGITTMMRMLRLGDSYKKSLPVQLDASSRVHYVDYTIHASIFNDSQINEMEFCTQKGVTSFKLYMNLGGDVGHVYMDMAPGSTRLHDARVEVNSEIVRKVVQKAAQLKCPVLVHAEDYESCACGIKTAKEKKQDGLGAWSESRSPDYEAKAIKTVSEFARQYNCTIYFVHIGSSKALKQIRIERKNGTKIFVETCPHYLTLSHDKQKGYLAKVMPPIRSSSDVEHVWGAIKQNEVDTVGTDHVANQLKLKLGGSDVWGALAGFPGIGTVLPILLSEGVNKDRINLQQLVKLTSNNAAKIFGMYPQKGSLEKNSDADITMIDLKKEKKVTTELFGGFSDYLVYDGWNLKGWPVKTIVRGEIIAEDFQVVGKPGYGKLVQRSI
ncbi:dihydroorotase [Nitrosopumilus sp. b1]|uniref:dihydroorotase n=1 Tax=Nitrosopumilus sp. b1 TaxID=2109907 RepID=UPI0015F6FBD9|nr:dihydroorotase family protein [Nitrosopumilus sp. b1]KAF6243946.1 dihydroorotase [Nitrosopumilus sp. b1]